MKTKVENYRYDESGLRGITLVGIPVSRCPECDEIEVTIPHIEGLHRAIADAIVRRRERLGPEEIRFLRKYLGLASADFAEHLGVSPETVSRWEQGRTPMGQTADRLVRLLVATREPVSDYPLELMKEVAQRKPKPLRVEMKIYEGIWQPASRAVA